MAATSRRSASTTLVSSLSPSNLPDIFPGGAFHAGGISVASASGNWVSRSAQRPLSNLSPITRSKELDAAPYANFCRRLEMSSTSVDSFITCRSARRDAAAVSASLKNCNGSGRPTSWPNACAKRVNTLSMVRISRRSKSLVRRLRMFAGSNELASDGSILQTALCSSIRLS